MSDMSTEYHVGDRANGYILTETGWQPDPDGTVLPATTVVGRKQKMPVWLIVVLAFVAAIVLYAVGRSSMGPEITLEPATSATPAAVEPAVPAVSEPAAPTGDPGELTATDNASIDRVIVISGLAEDLLLDVGQNSVSRLPMYAERMLGYAIELRALPFDNPELAQIINVDLADAYDLMSRGLLADDPEMVNEAGDMVSEATLAVLALGVEIA